MSNEDSSIEKLPRREREKLRQREEILTCALNLFSENGYQNVTMHEIAQKAEFAIGTIYKFFQNKEELYKAIILEQCNLFHASVASALESSDDVIETLRNYTRANCQTCRDNMAFVRLFLAEHRNPGFNIELNPHVEMHRLYHDTMDKLAAVFARGIKSQVFNNLAQPLLLALALDNTIHAFLLLWVEDPKQHAYPEDPDTILDIFFKGLLATATN